MRSKKTENKKTKKLFFFLEVKSEPYSAVLILLNFTFVNLFFLDFYNKNIWVNYLRLQTTKMLIPIISCTKLIE